MNFATLQGLTIPEGVVTQITDASGRVLWAVSGGKIVLQVEKTTSNTYASETTYENEQFILFDIYPKTNGTVSVTYGGLTKTITDTSGVEEPNAQQVFFGTFNGVSDDVETPANGKLTVEGDYRGIGIGYFATSSKSLITTPNVSFVTEIESLGNSEFIPPYAFYLSIDEKFESVKIPSSVKEIGERAFATCRLTSFVMQNGVIKLGYSMLSSTNGNLTSIVIPASVTTISDGNPFQLGKNNILAVDSKNTSFKIDGNCLIEIATNTLISGFNDTIIPSYVSKIDRGAFINCELGDFKIPHGVTEIGDYGFYYAGLTSVEIPASVTKIGHMVFDSPVLTSITVLATVPPVMTDTSTNGGLGSDALTTIIVPKGCSEAYKAATGWSKRADLIVEAS